MSNEPTGPPREKPCCAERYLNKRRWLSGALIPLLATDRDARATRAMLDYARPLADPAMYNFYPPSDPAPLEDFQVFKKWTLPYGNYYTSAAYDYSEPEMEAATNVYHDLVNAKDTPLKEDYKGKYIVDWDEEDTLSWVLDTLKCYKINEYELPYHVFRIPGIALRGMKREDIVQLMAHHIVDPSVFKRIVDIVFQHLQYRLNDEHTTETPVPLRHVDGDPYDVLDLDKHRNYYRPGETYSPPNYESSEDTEDIRKTESASPDYGSDVSKSSEEDKKIKGPKRPPGRPKGSGRKISKRVKSVSVPIFLRNMLLDRKYCPKIIKWEDYSQGKFRFLKPDEVAKIWGKMKQNDHMTFEKFSRAMRYHYRQDVLVSVPTARLVYQFGKNGPDYTTSDPNFTRAGADSDSHSEHHYS